MAQSGSFSVSTTSTNDITARIEWSESNVSVANNTSDLNVKLIYRMNSSWYATYGSGYFKITVNGTAYEDNKYVSFASGTHEYTVIDHTFTITHNADGAKSVSIVVNNGYVAGTTGLSASSGSGTATLTTIARASQPSTTNGTFGSAITINTNRASSSFTHTLTMSMGSHSETKTSVGASLSWTIPASWADTIPAATSNTLSISCVTYNGSTNIGTKTTSCTVTIPDSWKPSVSITKTLTNGGDSSQVIVSVTTVNLSASGSASTGTSISSYSWSGGAVSGTGASKTHSPSSAGTYTYTVTVTDRRGRTGSASTTATAVSGVSSFSCNSSVNFGSALAVSISRIKSSFTHSVTYRISSSYTNTLTGQGTSASYTIPTSWAASVPSASSINMTVTVTTYNGSSSLGSASKTVSVDVPSSWVPSFTLSTTGVSTFNGLYLKSVSKVTVNASSASASTGSSIKSYSFSGPNLSTSANSSATSYSATSAILTTVGTNTYTVKVTDNRGRVTSKTVSITVTNYSAPTVRITVGRYDSEGTSDSFGDYGRMVVSGSYSAVTGNKWTLVLNQKKKTASSYSRLNTYNDQTGAVSATSSLFAADVDSAYDCQATITDTVGKTTTVTVALSTGKALMDMFKDKVIGFFSTASEELRQALGNATDAIFSGASANFFNGKTFLPQKESYDGFTDGWFELNRVTTSALLGKPQYDITNSTNYDLNNAYQIGTYVCGSSATGQTITNTPYKGAFRLFVTTIASNSVVPDTYVYRNQLLVSIDGQIFSRYGSTNTGIGNMVWSAWGRIATLDDFYPTTVASEADVTAAGNLHRFVPIRTGSSSFTLGGQTCPAYGRGWSMNYGSSDSSMMVLGPAGLFTAFKNGSTWTGKPLYPVYKSNSGRGSYIASVQRCSCVIFGDMVYGGFFVTVRSDSGSMTTGSVIVTLDIPRNFSHTVDLVLRAGNGVCAAYAQAGTKNIVVNQAVSAGATISGSFICSMSP